jgi:hypothetical protein
VGCKSTALKCRYLRWSFIGHNVPVKNRWLDGTIKVEGDRAVPKNENRRGIDSSFLIKKYSV